MSRKRKKRLVVRQMKRIPGLSRIPTGAALAPAVRRRVEREATRFGVTKSFVVAVALAHTFGLDHEEY